jgi:hypothetical protein
MFNRTLAEIVELAQGGNLEAEDFCKAIGIKY